MKALVILCIFVSCAFGSEISGLPESLAGPIRGYLSSTQAGEFNYDSSPNVQEFGQISGGVLYFNSQVFREFEKKEVERYAEYKSKTESSEVRVFIINQEVRFYFITIRYKSGAYHRYTIFRKR